MSHKTSSALIATVITTILTVAGGVVTHAMASSKAELVAGLRLTQHDREIRELQAMQKSLLEQEQLNSIDLAVIRDRLGVRRP